MREGGGFLRGGYDSCMSRPNPHRLCPGLSTGTIPCVVPYLALALSAFALVLAGVSLAAHWFRGQEHPDVTSLRAEVLDVLDKVEHWMKRDRQRRLRDSHEQPDEQPDHAATVPTGKQQLREVARARGLIR